ncbi:hypothetical protein [Microbulbifer taiwanensis]|uniref:hypothetical protein n=1 Tax=Microbulbifer taiwanensis TaxID=986746 RepID=UPI00360783B4
MCADARDFVADQLASRGKNSFDLIIDDLFGHGSGEAERAVAADPAWCGKLLQLLGDDGLLVSNFGSRRELLDSGWRERDISTQLRGAWTAEMTAYENAVLAVSRQPLSLAALTARAPDRINPQNPSRRLNCRLKRLP